MELQERFDAKTERAADGCLLWTAALDSYGYGLIKNEKGMRGAHRVAWELANGPIPLGLEVCHTCDTPACVEVLHLFLGTHAENMADKTAKGRTPRGSGHARAKLTEADIVEIRALKGVERAAVLGERYGVHRTAINHIWAQRAWTHAA